MYLFSKFEKKFLTQFKSKAHPNALKEFTFNQQLSAH